MNSYIPHILGLSIKLLGAVSVLAANLVITRTFESGQAGFHLYAMAAALFLSSVSAGGLQEVTLRRVSILCSEGRHEQARLFVASTSMLAGSIGLVFSILTIIVSGFVSSLTFSSLEFKSILTSYSLAVPFLAASYVLSAGLQGFRMAIKSTATLNVISNLVFAISVPVLQRFGEYSAGAIFVFASFGSFAFGAYWLRLRRAEPVSLLFNRRVEIYGYFDIFVFNLLSQANFWLGTLLSGILLSAEGVVVISVGQRLAMVQNLATLAVALIDAPNYASMFSRGDRRGLQEVISRSSLIMFLFAMPFFLILILVPEFVLSFFGIYSAAAELALRVMAVGQFVSVMLGPVGHLLLMTGHERIVRNTIIVTLTVSAGLMVLGYSLLGLVGVAFAISLSSVAPKLIFAYFAQKRLQVHIYPNRAIYSLWRNRRDR
ncbi:hypothetical protein [Pseudooceanicola lipolyticus]|uniref:hypothetical protein n=1 Tax=Pseudooceanicola lipolyticus TaxID=2029104 RepID=UPI00105682FC|nr:hypothetical protein [Pseudooceanicola lipolyticus]